MNGVGIGSTAITTTGLEIRTVHYCLEDLLESDELFVDYFNAFLRLPTFPEPLLYNRRTTGLEVAARNVRQKLSAKITAAFNIVKSSHGNSNLVTRGRSHSSKSKFSRNSETVKSADMLHTEYTVKTLDLEQGTQWLKERRLPAFMDGDFYFEYRLAKMFSQLQIAKRCKKVEMVELTLKDSILDEIRTSNSRLEMSIHAKTDEKKHDDSEVMLKKFHVNLGQATNADKNAVVSQAKLNFDTKTCGDAKTRNHSSLNRLSRQMRSTSSLHSRQISVNEHEMLNRPVLSTESTSNHNQFGGVGLVTASKSISRYSDKNRNLISPSSSFTAGCTDRDGMYQDSITAHDNDDDDDYDDGDDDDRVLCNAEKKRVGLKRRVGIQQFRTFLNGTSGEKVWNLWMDIERGKRMGDMNHLKRHLASMKERYTGVGAKYELAAESKSQLGLLAPANWNVDHLTRIQNRVLEPLLCYWAPSYLLQLGSGLNLEAVDLYKEYMKLKAIPEAEPFPMILPTLPHRPKSCLVLKPRPSTEGDSNLPAKQRPNLSTNGKLRPNEKENSTAMRPHTVPCNKSRGFEFAQNLAQQKENCLENVTENLPVSSPEKTRNSESKWKLEPSSAVLGYDQLLQALACEFRSGHFIRKNIENSKNQLWKNCLNFWECCQEYHCIFYEEPFRPEILVKKAKYLYSVFIGPGAEMSIDCSKELADDIHRKLEPPFEELFDAVEEYAIDTLYSAWESTIDTDLKAYNKIIKKSENRSVPINSAVRLYLQQKGLISKQRMLPPDDSASEMDFYNSTIESLPPDLRDFTLQRILGNRLELEKFREFLSDNYASLDLHCWLDIENRRRIPEYREVLRRSKAEDIKDTYLNRRYFFGPNSPADKVGQAKVIACGGGSGIANNLRPTNECLTEVQKYVQRRLEYKWVPLFLSSRALSRHNTPLASIGHVAEDIITQRKRRRQTISKMLNSKWIPTTEKITQLRQALLNPLTSAQFRKFVSVRGNRLENNILFWQEVQKFKELCYSNSDPLLIHQKGSVIVSHFLRSSIPPAVQVTVGVELAEQITREHDEQNISPYIFKDAQKRVFLDLLPHWDKFCTYRDQLSSTDDSPTDLLRQKKTDMKLIHRKKRKALSAKREQEKAQRRGTLGAKHQRSWLLGWSENTNDLDSEFEFSRGQPVARSYLKYLAAFKKEEVLARGTSNLSEILGLTTTSKLTERRLGSNEYHDMDSEHGSFGGEHFTIEQRNLSEDGGRRISNEVF